MVAPEQPVLKPCGITYGITDEADAADALMTEMELSSMTEMNYLS